MWPFFAFCIQLCAEVLLKVINKVDYGLSGSTTVETE